jgi:hypothetical protein
MKQILAILLALLPITCIVAQEFTSANVASTQSNDEVSAEKKDSTRTFILNAMPNANVIQSEAIRQLIYERYKVPVAVPKEMRGFRVQIYSSNKNGVAMEKALQLERIATIKLGLPVYVQADPPFWKVRVGDFKEKDEADKYAALIKRYFPELTGIYVVPDRIIYIKK